jgi:hypothetical protein
MVAVGDFNNDSRFDIAVANFGTNNVGIFLGLGNGSFVSQIELSTGTSSPTAICLADFDNDTRFDIATANYGTDSVTIFYGNGNGRFSNPHTYSTGYDSLPSSLAAGDFNNDSYLDLAIINYGTNNIGLLLQNSSRTFTDPIVFSTGSGSRPISIAVGHFDDDTLLDIVVTNSGTNNLAVYLNNGNGTFATKTINLADTSSPYSVGVGDFNGDNRLDIVFTNIGIQNVGVYLGYGHGTFLISKMYSTGSVSSISLAVGDLNKDNRLDVVVISNDTGSIDILLGSFEGFSNQSIYSIGSWPISVAVGDFNSDNRMDIVVANQKDNSVSVLLGCFTGHKSGELGGQRVFEINSGK